MSKISISANTSWYIYNFRKNTIKELIQKGHEVVVISSRDKYSDMLVALGAEFHNVTIDSQGKNPIRDLFTIFSFFKLFHTNRIDVALNFTPKVNIYSTLAGAILDIKIVNNISGLGGAFIENGFISKFVTFLYKISQSKASYIFFQNNDDMSLFIDKGIIFPSKCERIPGSGVDLSRFNYFPNSRKDNVIQFILIARMKVEKGVLHYIEASRQLKKIYGAKVNFNLLGFLGEGDSSSNISTEQMDSWVREGVVSYLGVSDAVETILERMDCVVLPSYYREGVPKTLLEAGAMGKLIVTTDSIGCRDTVDSGYNGFLCEPKSTQSLRDALEKVINLTPEERRSMEANSRQKIEQNFDEKIVIGRYLSVIDDLSSVDAN